jgi:uncharacterized protein with ParB-like and HNH nuclease domain
MDAHAVSLLAIFEKKLRLEVPLFQRQYVWSMEHQWEPLWEDISRKFSEYLDGRKDAPVHFLGAMVLDQKQTPITHVERRQIIDGQQRLTTFQIFLSAFRDLCRTSECEELGRECETFTLNRGMMSDPCEKYKVWPTKLDQQNFIDVVDSGSREELLKRYPLQWRKYARKPDPRPRIVESYLYFYDRLLDFFVGTTENPPLLADVPLSQRLDESFQALKNSLQVVAIDLAQEDDAQVIFETLNARGEPLLPADLLRNFIFLRAARKGEPQEQLYRDYWERFDDPFWRVEVSQGRLRRPRSDLFMQHFLASRLTTDIPVKHLFVEYKFWIEHQQPFGSVRDELETVSRQGDQFRRIIAPSKDDELYRLSNFLETFDVGTVYPLLLALLEAGLDSGSWREVSGAIESYILRRSVCGMSTKNYNRVFLGITRNLRKDGFSCENLVRQLAEQVGESTEWPKDDPFGTAWLTTSSYQVLNNPKIVFILKRLNETYMNSKMENIPIESALTVEHILPNQWIANWPLPGGVQGLSWMDTLAADPNDPVVVATNKRNALLHTFGNLTILTQPLNSSVSNSAWKDKKRELLKHSLLPINQRLQPLDEWNEDTISQRGRDLLDRALSLWPRPQSKSAAVGT